MGISNKIIKSRSKANAIELDKLPYSFAGGHDPAFEPSRGTNGLVGYDCSGAASAVLHAGEILEHPSGPLGTEELESWGLPGEGQYLTLWVINNSLIHHCLIEFKEDNGDIFWWAARHEGTLVGYFVTGYPHPTEFRDYLKRMGYQPRRRK